MKDLKYYDVNKLKFDGTIYEFIYSLREEGKKMDKKYRDIQILNKNMQTIYVDRMIVGDIIVRENKIDVLYKGAITKTILLPEYLEGIKVLID